LKPSSLLDISVHDKLTAPEVAVPVTEVPAEPVLPLELLAVELTAVAQALFEGVETPALLKALTT
jgi:hypothetical protein